MKRAVVLHNPYSGSTSRPEDHLEQAVGALEKMGLEVRTLLSRPLNENLPPDQFEGADVLLIRGGDGTIHSALPAAIRNRIPIALLPSGTANVLARELEIPLDPLQAVALLRHGKRVRMYLGRSGSRYFHLMAGIGVDSHVIRRVNPVTKKRLGVGSYYLAGLRSYPSLPLVPFQVRFQGQVHKPPSL